MKLSIAALMLSSMMCWGMETAGNLSEKTVDKIQDEEKAALDAARINQQVNQEKCAYATREKLWPFGRAESPNLNEELGMKAWMYQDYNSYHHLSSNTTDPYHTDNQYINDWAFKNGQKNSVTDNNKKIQTILRLIDDTQEKVNSAVKEFRSSAPQINTIPQEFQNPDNTAVVLVDLQRDFTHAFSGSLPVGTTNQNYIERTLKATKALHDQEFKILATLDSHPWNHISFKSTHIGANKITEIAVTGAKTDYPSIKLNGIDEAEADKLLNSDAAIARILETTEINTPTTLATAFNSLPEGKNTQILWNPHCVRYPGGVSQPDRAYPDAVLESWARGGIKTWIPWEWIAMGFPKGTGLSDSYSGVSDIGGRVSTGLLGYLDLHGIKNAIVYGLATDYCVKDTVKDLLKAGINVLLIENLSDAVMGPNGQAGAIVDMQAVSHGEANSTHGTLTVARYEDDALVVADGGGEISIPDQPVHSSLNSRNILTYPSNDTFRRSNNLSQKEKKSSDKFSNLFGVKIEEDDGL